ncbi:protein MANNAN SYNTHESIS-RELATED 1 isoform X3 [Andrographis paniculata]|uniref:protein MANNAN SYNTHESIS-RELATED 1 isoform X3 n=1 Tax=Andrographis paniculata TaxID=175694 RepID=UPI0021E7205E|nr:protein MANNAN SYNTHESIS-RELATED 1 isoform X3 [Andrographis paniculata]
MAMAMALALGADPRHVLAGLLTLTMFLILAAMVKRDYYYAPPRSATTTTTTPIQGSVHGDGPKGDDYDDGFNRTPAEGFNLKPCWQKPVFADDAVEWRGYVTFSLTNGPEFHVSQIADAVVVARYLRAVLVIPKIRQSATGDDREFEDVYSVEKFIESLESAVKVVKSMPWGVSGHNLTVVKVPNRVTKEYVAEHIGPIFRARGNIKIVTYFPSVNMRKNNNVEPAACLGMFGTLEPQREVGEVVELMVNRLRSSSNGGQLVAVDLRMEVLEKKGCRQQLGPQKSCYGAKEVGVLLRNMGFDKGTTVVYVTQTRWHNNLYALKDLFPKTYTKESILPMERKEGILNSEALEKAIDFYMCSESDVYVPAISGLFYANVAGRRIASGRTRILVPPANIHIPAPAPADEFLSPYVSKKNHIAYSCFC